MSNPFPPPQPRGNWGAGNTPPPAPLLPQPELQAQMAAAGSTAPAQPQSGPPVPVVPATSARLAARYGATLLTALGAVAQSLPTITPQLHALFPTSRLVALLMPVGLLWLTVQRALDGKTTTPVNLTPPGVGVS